MRGHWNSEPQEFEVEGFLVHEVAGIIPKAVMVEHVAVEKYGRFDPQQFDIFTLILMLVAALQQALVVLKF